MTLQNNTNNLYCSINSDNNIMCDNNIIGNSEIFTYAMYS